MSFFSSKRDHITRSWSKDNLKHSQYHAASASSSSNDISPPVPKKLPSHLWPSSKQDFSPTHSKPAFSLTHSSSQVPSSPNKTRSDSMSPTTKSFVARVPVPTQESLLARKNSVRSARTTSPGSPVAKSPSTPVSLDLHNGIGNGSDAGSARGGSGRHQSINSGFRIASRFDLKRLMNKSAQSTSSLVSNMSGSESSIRIRKPPREGPSRDLLVDVPAATAVIKSEPSSATQPRFMSLVSGQNAETRRPNVLRRKQSKRGMSASETPSSTPIYSLLRSKPNTDLFPLARRSVSSPGHSRPMTADELTPAGAVAAAYKQQEQNKESFASISRLRKDPTVLPHYTVLDDRPSKAVSPGGLEDIGTHANFDGYHRGRSKSAAFPSSSSLNPIEFNRDGLKKLSRKVSAKWKKTSSGAVLSDDEGALDKTTDKLERTTSQEDRPATLSYKRHKPLRLSIDGFGDATATNDPGSPSGGDWPAQVLEMPHQKEKNGESSSGGKLWKLVKRLSTGGLKDKYAVHGSTPPPPVPALPKNLEIFSLTPQTFETRYCDDVIPPSGPIPPLSRFVDGRSSFSESPRPLYRHNTERNASGPPPRTPIRRPVTAGAIPSSAAFSTRPSTTTASSSPDSSDMTYSKFWNRARSARSSLSSYGEEVPPVPKSVIGQQILSMSEFYRFERGDEESTPSTAESPTRSPPSQPSPLRAATFPLLDDRDDSPRSGEFVRPSLPIPPRRHTNHHHNHHQTPSAPFPSTKSEAVSPSISSIMTKDDAIQSSNDPDLVASALRGLSQSPLPRVEFGVSSLPPSPRLARSTRRMMATRTSISGTPPSAKKTLSASTIQVSPEEIRGYGTLGNRVVSQQPRKGSNVSISTRRGSVASESNKSLTGSPGRSALRFREIGSSSKKQAWTEKEKADRWDDLLEMSDQAGGTIHLGDNAGLMSDSVRYSISSSIDQAGGE